MFIYTVKIIIIILTTSFLLQVSRVAAAAAAANNLTARLGSARLGSMTTTKQI